MLCPCVQDLMIESDILVVVRGSQCSGGKLGTCWRPWFWACAKSWPEKCGCPREAAQGTEGKGHWRTKPGPAFAASSQTIWMSLPPKHLEMPCSSRNPELASKTDADLIDCRISPNLPCTAHAQQPDRPDITGHCGCACKQQENFFAGQ